MNLKELKKNLNGSEVIEHNLEQGIPKISDDILSNSIVITSDVIEHIVKPDKYLRDLASISKKAPYVIVSTPDRDRVRGLDDLGPPDNPAHVREWSAGELHSLLDSSGISNLRTGYTINTNVHKEKSTIISMGGAHSLSKNMQQKVTKLKRVLAIVTVFNEEDIIRHSIINLIAEGVDIHVIDNWSTDTTQKVVEQLTDLHPRRITYEKFPEKPPKKYEWEKLLKKVDDVAKNSKHDWIIHHDADEIRKSPHPKITIQEAITQIDAKGYNIIDHTVLDFRPTQPGYTKNSNPEEFFTHFEYGRRPGHFVQKKGWKNTGKKVDLHISGGHSVVVDAPKVYPLKFLIKHYPLRSKEQATKKIFSERKPRISKEESAKGWHHQYNKYNKSDQFVWDENTLHKFHKIMFWQEDFVEQVSGVGVSPTNNDK